MVIVVPHCTRIVRISGGPAPPLEAMKEAVALPGLRRHRRFHHPQAAPSTTAARAAVRSAGVQLRRRGAPPRPPSRKQRLLPAARRSREAEVLVGGGGGFPAGGAAGEEADLEQIGLDDFDECALLLVERGRKRADRPRCVAYRLSQPSYRAAQGSAEGIRTGSSRQPVHWKH